VKGNTVAEILAFDLYGTLVDPLAIAADLTEILGADGSEVARQWRATQLEYSFRLSAMGSYLDFRAVTAAALDFALASAGLGLTSGQRQHLAERYDHLPPLADAAPALRALTERGFELAVLSNGTPDMIAACLASSGLDVWVSHQLSADQVRVYKPAAQVYLNAAQRLSRSARELRLVSGNAFDISGAAAAGLRTAWVNRMHIPFDTIGEPPQITVSDLRQLPAALIT
jgi:2-haloacid dehalogenase